MSVGTGVGLAIAGGLGAGAQLYGAKKASSASKKAAETQAGAGREAALLQYQLANQALAAQAQERQRMQQLYAPYTQAAPQSLGALYKFLGIPSGAPAGGPPQGGGMPPGAGGVPGYGGGQMPTVPPPFAMAGPRTQGGASLGDVYARLRGLQGSRPSGADVARMRYPVPGGY